MNERFRMKPSQSLLIVAGSTGCVDNPGNSQNTTPRTTFGV